MSNPITTSGLQGGDVATDHQSGQSTRQWVDAHDAAIDAAGPKGDKLTTTWTSASGPQSVVTTRWLDEDDAHFLARHEGEYLPAMNAEPPIP